MSNPNLRAQRTTFGRDRSRYICGIVLVRPTGHLRWDSSMGPKMGDLLDNPQASPEGEAGHQLTVFGGATSLTKPEKNTLRMAFGTTGPNHADLLRWI